MNKRKVRLGRTLLVNKKAEESLFFVQHPLLASIIMGAVFFVLIFILGTVSSVQGASIFGTDLKLSAGISAAFNSLLFVIFAETFMIIAKDMKFGSSFVSAMLMSVPFAIYLAIMNMNSGRAVSPEDIGTAIFAGALEEVVFRFIPVVCYKRPGVKKTPDAKIALISAVLFGIYHIPNLAISENIVYELMGIFFAMFTGFYFAGVYLKSGIILAPMALHIANNIVFAKIGENTVLGIVSLAVSAVLAVFTFNVLRKETFLEKTGAFLEKKLSFLKKKPKIAPAKQGYYKKR